MTDERSLTRPVYDEKQLVSSYDDRRFGGVGGAYVLERELDLVTEFLGPTSGPVLDVPCGTGLLRSRLDQAGYSTIAADASARMLEVTRRRSADPVVRCDAFSLPFEADSVDASCTLRLFQHYPADAIERLLGELRRVVTPSGRIVFDTFRWSPRNTPLFDGGVYTYSDAEVDAILARVGLEPIATESAFVVTPILYRKCPGSVVSVLDAADRLIPDRALVRTFWCCTPRREVRR